MFLEKIIWGDDNLLGMMVALLVIIVCGYLIVKEYKAQAVLLAGGFVMMVVAIVFNFGPMLPAKQSTGFIWFDLFKYVEDLLTTRTASLGILIMTVAGFARYIDKIGCGEALVDICIRPLKAFKSPYLILSMGFIIGQFMHLVIPSASDLGLILMVTLYPIYRALGISKTSATAVIGTNTCLDLGPASANAVLSAKTAGMPVIDYFIQYQVPMAITITLVVAVVHFFVQRWFDNKYDGALESRIEDAHTDTQTGTKKINPPAIYAILPVLPLVFIIAFSYMHLYNIKMDIVSAMFVSLLIGMIFELIRIRNVKKVFAGIQSFFDGMGAQFATVVTLIVAGEVFAKGLTSLGTINTVIQAAESFGFGKIATILVMTVIIAFSTVVMGSGNAPFFAFASFAPEIANKMGFEAVNLLLPMQIASSVARSLSPISAVMVAICGISQISPFETVKRTAIPMMVGLLLTQIVTFILFGV